MAKSKFNSVEINCILHSVTLTLTPKRVILAKTIVSFFAVVTALTLYIGLTVTLTTNHSLIYISMTVTPPFIQRAHWVTITSCTKKKRKKPDKWKII